MKSFRLTRMVCLFCVAAGTSFGWQVARCQDATPSTAARTETAEETKQRVTAERFLQLLRDRPRLGTALDKVYGYHVGRGSLDPFADSLEAEATENKDGNVWMILGMVQMQRGQDALAAASFEKAEALLPEQTLASYYLGKTLVLLGEVDQAAEAMRRAIERQPARADMLAIFQDLGRIYQRTGRNQEALDVWKQLEALFPGDAQVREQIANILAEEGALEAALERYVALSTTVKDRFRQVEMAIRAAQLKAQLGKNDEALADLEQQLAVINPDSWLYRDVRRRIEEVFWSSGDVDGLVAYYTRWIQQHPDDVDAMMRSARVLSVQRRLPEAEKWFRDAIAKAPSKAEPRLALVESLVTEGRYDQAAKETGELVELQPDNPDYIVRWGELVFSDLTRNEEERKTQAAAIWRRMLAKRGDDPVTVARVADLLRGSGSTDAAIEQYQAAIKLAPNEPQYREYLGEFLHQLGRKDEALATWRELAADSRENRDNLVRLSEVLSTFHYSDEALATMAKACEMKPTFGHRARYAELLREAKKFDEALAQLDLAEPLADDPELRELVVEERIKNYQASGTLAQRIEQAEVAVAGDKANDATTWRLLALLRDADRKFQLACEAIEKATALDPGNATTWETAATIQERSGRFGDAIASYRKLATLDRRYLSNYLTQIASLEMQLGNTDAALKTGEELIASAPGNSEHYRFFADLCFRAANRERGFDVLRRSVRSNPNDEEALLYLARMLADEFETDEAIELYWRGFDLAKDIDGKAAVIGPLAELYLRTNRFDSLVDRLEIIGREQNKPRDGLLWVAAAHQAAGDLGMARQLLERLAREDSRDTKLLEQLVSLSRAEFDFEVAAEYQKRLVAAAPSPESEYLLANLLLEVGQIDEAEAMWLKLSQRGNEPSALMAAISTLLNKEQFETAAVVIENAMARQPRNWELLASAMIAYVKLDRKDDARRVAELVLAMDVDPAEPTEKVKEAIEKQASRRNNKNPNQYNPYADLGQPPRLLQSIQQIKQAMTSTNRSMRPGQNTFTPSCFQDVQALAYCMPLMAADKGFDASAFIKQYAAEALESAVPDRLWRAIAYLAWQDPRVQYAQTPNATYNMCLNMLVEQQDPFAANNLLVQMVVQRQNRSNNETTQLEPLSKPEVEQIKHWSRLASKADQAMARYYDVWVAMELSRAGEEDEAEKLIDQYVEKAKTSSNAQMAMLQAMSLILSDRNNEKPSPRMFKKAREWFRVALESLSVNKSVTNSAYGQQFAGLVGQLVKHGSFDDAIAALDDVLHWQAVQTAGMRPTLREGSPSNSAALNYNKIVNRQYVQLTIPFPPVSGYFGAESISTLYGIYEACKEDEAQLSKLKDIVGRWAAEPGDDVYLRFARLLADASLAYWTDDRQRAQEILVAAADLQVGGQFLQLARSRVLYETGKVREALAIVEQLRPTNQQMLVDRELTILQLVLQLGDLERARKSAQKLFALRLDSEVEFRLADLMYQLGMNDLADRMMGRIRRRAGGKQDTLVKLMARYADASDNEAAAEIARQVIRRTTPRGAQDYQTTENQQHEQAVRILAQANMLGPLIEQYEGLVERSPKSTKLVDKLCAFYEAAGRRDDAQKLRLKAVENAPDDPRSLYAAGQQLTKLRKHDEAVEKYIAAIIKSPETLNQNFHNMRTSFEATKGWSRLSDAIVLEGIKNFSQSYRLNDICSELSRQKDHAAVNRFLFAALSELEWSELSQVLYSFASVDFKPDEKLVKLLGEKLTAQDASFNTFQQNAFVWSRSSNGHTSGSANGIAKIVAGDDKLREEVIAAMSKHLETANDELFPRVLLCLVRAEKGEFDEVKKSIQPLVAKQDKTQTDAYAIWCVASMLTHDARQPGIACDLLESVKSDLLQDNGSGFQYTITALLAYSYEKAGRNADAHRILVQELKTASVDERQSQYNPGYGEYQYIQSLSELAERFLKMGYPAEAFIAYRKAFADESKMEASKRWGGNLDHVKETLGQQIAAKRDVETILGIVKASVGTKDAATDEATRDVAAFLTEPEVERNSLIDNRVTMPLEQFTLAIAQEDALRKAVSQWLHDNPLPDDSSAIPLKALVTRLLMGDAAHDEEQILATSKVIGQWVRSHDPPKSAAKDESSAAPPAEANAKKPSSKPSSNGQPETSAPKPLPDELLLGMAALRMPAETIDADEVVRMLERAIIAAKANDEPALVGSLQCQIAKRVALAEPDRARAIFLEALDELLPVSDKDTDVPSAKEAK